MKLAGIEVITKGQKTRQENWPALKYIQGEYLDFVRDIMDSDRARERTLFRREYVDELFADPGAHITPLRGSKLWQVTLLEYWLQQQGL